MQRRGQQLLDTIEPFGGAALVSNFNLTLGQKDVLNQLLSKKKMKTKRHEKENHGSGKDTFRIRKKLPQ